MPDTGKQSVVFSWGGEEDKVPPSLEQLISRIELLQLRFRTFRHDRDMVLDGIEKE